MRAILYGLGWTLGSILVIGSMVLTVRKAKRGNGTATALVAGLLMGLGAMPGMCAATVQEAKERKGKKGAESGDPPFPEGDG